MSQKYNGEPTKTWWCVKLYGCKIEPVKVVKETARFLSTVATTWDGKDAWITRTAKRSSYDNHFPTWEEAHAYLYERETKRLAGLRRDVKEAERSVEAVRKMEEPSDADSR
jgi:N-glycosylase/DNA lyase